MANKRKIVALTLTLGVAVHLWRVRKDGGVVGSAGRHRHPGGEQS